MFQQQGLYQCNVQSILLHNCNGLEEFWVKKRICFNFYYILRFAFSKISNKLLQNHFCSVNVYKCIKPCIYNVRILREFNIIEIMCVYWIFMSSHRENSKNCWHHWWKVWYSLKLYYTPVQSHQGKLLIHHR